MNKNPLVTKITNQVLHELQDKIGSIINDNGFIIPITWDDKLRLEMAYSLFTDLYNRRYCEHEFTVIDDDQDNRRCIKCQKTLYNVNIDKEQSNDKD
jgi:hypothetical protein